MSAPQDFSNPAMNAIGTSDLMGGSTLGQGTLSLGQAFGAVADQRGATNTFTGMPENSFGRDSSQDTQVAFQAGNPNAIGPTDMFQRDGKGNPVIQGGRIVPSPFAIGMNGGKG
jgi:hypothetical protein